MAVIHIDNTPYEVDGGQNLLQACLTLGFDLPYFCWHPALGSVGACRQCAVKQFRDENDQKGRLVMACMSPAADGARISVNDEEARQFRAAVIEWLMTNHPHDCPVCPEGGECHLQDMTVMTGHTRRRYRFDKRTHRNQDLGPFIDHEMNRCIACYRCVRFYRDYAGGRDLHAFASHHHVYFGRHRDGALESPFSGNLVEVCPTGVFTDKTLGEHYVRKWDLQTSPSVCVHCGLGCNTSPGERYGILRRIQNRYNAQVNGYFLCDRGRFGYGFVNGPGRLRQPLLRVQDMQPAGEREVFSRLVSLLGASSRLWGIGSPRASVEANFALRTLVGAERFCTGVGVREHRLLAAVVKILKEGSVPAASLAEAEAADAVLVLGEDVTHTAPRLALSLRQALRQSAFARAEALRIPRWQDAAVREAAAQVPASPLFVAAAHATALDDVAAAVFRGAPDDIARLGSAVAHGLNGDAPAVADAPPLAGDIAAALGAARRPLIVAGVGGGSEALLQAAAQVAWSLNGGGRHPRLAFVVPECNSLGVALLGGFPLESAFEAVQRGGVDTLIVLENDLYRRADPALVDGVLTAAPHLIVIDHELHATAARAELALPAGTFAEGDGTLVNNEGRAQRFFQTFVPAEEIRESWRWLRDFLNAAGRGDGAPWRTLDDVTAACAAALPVFRGIPQAAPPAAFRVAGMRVPRAPHRYSGRTAMHAADIHEPKPPADPDSPLAFSMEGYYGSRLPGALLPYVWAPGWNSVQALNKFQDEVGGALRDGAGVRLLEAKSEAAPAWFNDLPPAFAPRPGEWLVIPLYHVFGSEELSNLAPPIVKRSPAPYLALHPDDAAGLGLADGNDVDLTLDGRALRLPVQYRADLCRGLAGLPAGMSDTAGIDLPAWGRIAGVGS